MLSAIIICVFATVCFIMVCLLSMIFKNRLHVQARIKSFVHGNEKESGKLEGSFADRIIKPMLGRTNSILDRITPKHYYNQVEKRIKEAGSPRGISVGVIVLLQMLFACISAAAAVMGIARDVPPAKAVVSILLLSAAGLNASLKTPVPSA